MRDDDWTNGPLELSSFVGRERDLEDLHRLIATRRLVTLVGPPGVGKSRLAVRAARLAAAAGGQPVRVVDLSGHGPRSAARAVLALAAPRERNAWLVLDNCDRALAVCARLITALLGDQPNSAVVKIVATSRQRVGVAGEAVWRVGPLDVPPEGATFRAIEASPSVRLFVDRAQAVEPHFALNAANGREVARLCRELDGLPLAIELAAARAIVLSLGQIAQRLDAAIRLRSEARPTATDRRHGLRSAIEWSVDSLARADRRLLAHLGVFPASWDVEAAAAVCSDDQLAGPDVAPHLARLVSRSLVQLLPQAAGVSPRYAMLGVMRRYARAQAEAEGALAHLQRRHAEWYVGLAESMPFGAGSAEVLERVRLDQPNLEAALDWAIGAGDVSMGYSLATRLHGPWYIRGQFPASRAWFARLLALPGWSPPARVALLNWASNHATGDGAYAAALALSRTAATAAAELGEPVLKAITLDGLATLLLDRGDLDEAEATFEQELRLCTPLDGVDWLRCAVLYRLAAIRLERGRLAEAQGLAERALALLGEDRNLWMELRAWNIRGRVALERGQLAAAEEWLARALALARQIQDVRGTSDVLIDLARLERRRRHLRTGCRRLGEALAICEGSGEKLTLIRVLEAVVALRAATRPEAAVQLAGAATALRAQLGARLLPRERDRLQQAVATAGGRLSQLTAEQAWTVGGRLGRAGAADLARELLEGQAAASGPPAGADALAVLTPREREIAWLVASGATNRAIGRQLLISQGTVRAHVEHILGKLELRSRTEIAAHLT